VGRVAVSEVEPLAAQIAAEWVITDPVGDLARWREGMRAYEAGSLDDGAAMGAAAELMCAGLAHYVADGTVIGNTEGESPETAVAQTSWNVLVATLHGGGAQPLSEGSARCLRLALAAVRRGGFQVEDLGGNGLMAEMFDNDSRAVMAAALSGLPAREGESLVQLARWFTGQTASKPVLTVAAARSDAAQPGATSGDGRKTAAGSRLRDLRNRAQQARQYVNPVALQHGIEAVQGALTGAQVAKVDRAGNLKIRKFGVAKAALRPSKTLRRALDGAALADRLKAYNQQVYGVGSGPPAADTAPPARLAGTGPVSTAASRPRVPPLGSGRRLTTSQNVVQCISLLESLLATYRTPKYQHLPPYAFPRWAWHGPSAAPTTVVACDDQAEDFMLIAIWPAGTGSELGVFPLGSGDDRLESLPLIDDWAARDATLRSAGTYGPGLISLAPPQVTRGFTEELLTIAGYPHTPHNLARATRQLAIMFLVKAQELISAQDPRAAQRFARRHAADKFFGARPASPPEDYLNWILTDLASWNPGFLPYIQELPVRLRAIMLNSLGKAPFWNELQQ
jgi:hypothetical protein